MEDTIDWCRIHYALIVHLYEPHAVVAVAVAAAAAAAAVVVSVDHHSHLQRKSHVAVACCVKINCYRCKDVALEFSAAVAAAPAFETASTTKVSAIQHLP